MRSNSKTLIWNDFRSMSAAKTTISLRMGEKIGDFCHSYVTSRRRRDSRQCKSIIRTRIESTGLGALHVREARPAHFQRVLSEMKEFGLSPRTRDNFQDFVHAVFQSALDEGLIDKNPVPKERGLNVDVDPDWREDARFEQHELAALTGNPLVAQLHQCAFEVLRSLALRVSELAALTLDWIDFTKEPLPEVRIAEAYNTNDREFRDTKTHIIRKMPLNPRAGRRIKQMVEVIWPKLFGRSPRKDEPLFSVHWDKEPGTPRPLRNDRAWKWLVGDCSKLNIRPRGTHIFRATTITELFELGVPWLIIERMTHATPSGIGLLNSLSTHGRAVGGYIRPRYKTFCDAVLSLPGEEYRDPAQLNLPLFTRI